jgi:hypothetical protein
MNLSETWHRFLHLSAARIDWGDFPTWAAFVAAIAAVVVSSRSIRRSLGIERDARARRELEERQAQAVTVAVWRDLGQGTDKRHPVVIRNGSDAPVYRACLIGSLARGGLHSWANVGTIPPGAFSLFFLDDELPHVGREVGVMFRDAQGNEWTRDFDGVVSPGRAHDTDTAVKQLVTGQRRQPTSSEQMNASIRAAYDATRNHQ